MGEVYRATDTALGRDVAIKVLPAAVAHDTERLARFDREARTLAALNHPNIAQIYGREDAGGVPALVMELVEGPTLADRIAQGRLPTDDALSIAKQMADALEAAHEQGIVHRDLKPANVKMRADGTVKVLDFGLAKAMEPASAHSASARQAEAGVAFSQAPTITSPAMTQLGLILGTAAYMAPEQASGRPVDKRADIWAFGVVLWEMVMGRQLFEGDTVSHVLAAVLTTEPDLTAVPPRVRPLLARCLEKDPKRRLRDIGDAISLVAGAEPPAGVAAGPADGSRLPRWLTLGGWAVGGLAAVLAGIAWLRPAPVLDAESPPVHFQIERTTDVYNRTSRAFAVSPDGLKLAYYGAGADGPQTLLVRTLATGEVRELSSSTAVPLPDSLFWSPDSRQLVRGTASGAQVFDVATGSTRPLCECRWIGGSWSREGTILLGGLGPGSGIMRLSPGESAPVQITSGDAKKDERDGYPVALPDGKRFLFTRVVPGQGGAVTYVGSLDGSAPKRVADGSRRAFMPAAAGRPAYLLGVVAEGVIAQPFDPDTASVTGPGVTVVASAVAVSASENGVLATSAEGSRPRTIPTWFDRKGASLGTVGTAALIDAIALSPDGQRLAISESEGERQGQRALGPRAPRNDIWLHDLRSGARTRLTFGRGSSPVWSPDGRTVAYTGPQGSGVYHRSVDGTGAESPMLPLTGPAWINDWSRDGRLVVYSTPGRDGVGNDLWSLSTEAGAQSKPVPYIVGPSLQQQAQLSPDGRFVAYGSDQAGGWEIFVQPFPNASDGKWMVSNNGGAEPRWSPDGKELHYFAGQTLMAVPVSLRPTFSAGVPAALFDAPVQAGNTNDSHRWLVAPDGKRFLLLVGDGKNQAEPLDVVVNWPALLRQ
jgi:eukaryotic-like serine/threonine-protein kinase